MACRHLGQFDLGIEADLLEIRDAVAGQGIVQILGNRIGIKGRLAIDHFGGSQLRAPGYVANPVQESRGEFAFLDLLPDDSSRFGIE